MLFKGGACSAEKWGVMAMPWLHLALALGARPGKQMQWEKEARAPKHACRPLSNTCNTQARVVSVRQRIGACRQHKGSTQTVCRQHIGNAYRLHRHWPMMVHGLD